MYKDIKQVLHKFNEGYVQRDVEKLDDYMSELFVDSPDTMILGTSNGEMCLGSEAAKKLVKMDWLHWGDFRVNVDSALYQESGEAVWFAAQATLEMVFKYSEESLERQVGFFREDLQAASEHPLQGLTHINWLLRHVLAAREGGDKPSVYPMRLTGAVVRDGEAWKFSYMQFSVPCSTYPDERVGNAFLDQMHPVKPFAVAELVQSQNRSELVALVAMLSKGFSCGDFGALLKNPGLGTDPYLIDPRGTIHRGRDSMEMALANIRRTWGHMELALDNSVSITKGDLSWVVSAGTMVKCEESDHMLKRRIADSLTVLDLELSAKERLFLVARDIAHSLKEVAHGSTFKWPCRVEVVFSKREDAWVLNNMQLSFPYYWILEGKFEGVISAGSRPTQCTVVSD